MENKKVFIVIDNRKLNRGVQLDIAEIDTYTGNKEGLKTFSVDNNILLTENYYNKRFTKPYEKSLYYILEKNKDCRAYENYKDALEFIKLLFNNSIENTIKNKKASEEKLKILDVIKGDLYNFENVLAKNENLDEKLLLEFNRNTNEI